MGLFKDFKEDFKDLKEDFSQAVNELVPGSEEPGIRAKIVDKDGNILSQGTRGFLHVSSAAAADRYLNDELQYPR